MEIFQLIDYGKRVATSMTVLALLAGCASASRTETVTKDTLSGSRVQFLKECIRTSKDTYADAIKTAPAPEAGFLLSLAASLVPSVLNKLVEFTGAYAEKVGKEYSSTSTAATSVLLADSAVRGCIIYVAGEFGPAQAGTDGSGWTAEQFEKLGLARRPDVYAEFVLHSVDGDGKFAAVTPVLLDFKAPQALRTSSSNAKDVSFVIELAAPTNTISKTSSSGAGGVTPPAAVPAISGAEGPKAVAPEATAKAPAAIPSKDETGSSTTVATFAVTFGKVSVGSKYELRALTGLRTPSQHLDRGNQNLNIAVTSIETENGGDFLLKLSSFLAENKKTIVDTSQPFVLKAWGLEERN